MKKTLSILILLFIFLHTQLWALTLGVNLTGKKSSDNAFIVENKQDNFTDVEAVIKLTPIKKSKVHCAVLAIVADVEGTQPSNASLTFESDHKTIGATTLKDGSNTACVIITDAINDSIERGKINVKICQRGVVDAQKTVKIKDAFLVVSEESLYDFDEYMQPIWKSGKMVDESVFLFSDEKEGAVEANLIFKPSKVLRVHNVLENKDFKEGDDFIIDGKKIRLTSNSKIPHLKHKDVYSDTYSKQSGCTFAFHPIKKYALFHEGKWFHQRMIYVTYEHEDSLNPKNFDCIFEPQYLKRTLTALRSKEPLKIVLYGDSISHGANASARSTSKPFLPSWGDIIASGLKKKYAHDKITFINRALGGTNSQWALKNIDSLVVADMPDLVILAFGMNDGHSAQERTKYIQEMIAKVRAFNPKSEFIIVTPMLPNDYWKDVSPFASYEDSDQKLKADGVAVANVQRAHKTLLKYKRFIDMTGNNVNHPNDFLIRVYAQTILAKLGYF